MKPTPRFYLSEDDLSGFDLTVIENYRKPKTKLVVYNDCKIGLTERALIRLKMAEYIVTQELKRIMKEVKNGYC